MFESLYNAKMELRKPQQIGEFWPGSDTELTDIVSFTGVLAKVEPRDPRSIFTRVTRMLEVGEDATDTHVFVLKMKRADLNDANTQVMAPGQNLRLTHDKTRGTWVAVSPERRYMIRSTVFNALLEQAVVHLVEM